MCWLTDTRGQATVEAAFAIPIVFVLLLLLLQPGIILYDRMVMRSAAAEGCRLLATRSLGASLSDDQCIGIIKRQLSAIPPHDLFHIHHSGCSWDIGLEGDETASEVGVSISNRIHLLPLFDAFGATLGIADAQGCLSIHVEERAPTQAPWVQGSKSGLNPSEWVEARKGA
ncbi:MAG: pilus assembly protein [Eggerthellaceae bacterium]|nr:pilus assembly protein [Eggerthellaceae bacterium]